ncbi:response regulator transcription factor [Amycolatopsis sp. NPDC059021]|uniref:response regulator transcription factor n=1 Tax=Amycolatopsis sp. NPDC059021 TaxID=3346704 RepID=UPI00366E9D62
MRVLVLEDDLQLGEVIAAGLRSIGFAVDLAVSIAEADLKTAVNSYDCLVIDRMLPDGDGLDFVRVQRTQGARTPVLMLTARDTLADKVDGFTIGADDYLVKPFAQAELTARVIALCRRAEHPVSPTITSGDLELDLARRRVSRGGVVLSVTPKEFAVLELLLRRAGQVVSRSELIERCWDEMAEPMSNVVDVVIAQLRRKLGPPALITTVRGTGFLVDADG